MSFTFQPNQLVVNLVSGERMTAGRAYRVHSSYDGHSGCGAQEWCRVADDSGRVVGFDPSRFILANPEGLTPNAFACAAALRSRKTVVSLLREFQGESFAAVREKLSEVYDDVCGVIAATAALPASNQVTFQPADADLEGRALYSMQSVVGIDTIPVAWLRYPKVEGAYTLTVGDKSYPLDAADYAEAVEAVQAKIRWLANGGDLGFWAITRHVATPAEEQRAFDAARA